MAVAIWSIFFYLIEQLTAQIESSMGVQSNLDDVRRKDFTAQCPGEWQWACHNGECIARYDACDGIAQCSDGSDEWNCERWRQNNGGFNKNIEGNKQTTTTTMATSTTTVANSGFIVLSTREVVIAFGIFVVLAIVVVSMVRRRARMKVLARNRRGNLLQGDSDEDDILISSMYS
ncbi:Low-density lipoprotein receptor domain class A [Ostertagia ostertagi]